MTPDQEKFVADCRYDLTPKGDDGYVNSTTINGRLHRALEIIEEQANELEEYRECVSVMKNRDLELAELRKIKEALESWRAKFGKDEAWVLDACLEGRGPDVRP